MFYQSGLNMKSERSGIIMEVHLSRPLFGSILKEFFPTIILICISRMVCVFRKDFLDMVIAVNVTLLLVLSTL